VKYIDYGNQEELGPDELRPLSSDPNPEPHAELGHTGQIQLDRFAQKFRNQTPGTLFSPASK